MGTKYKSPLGMRRGSKAKGGELGRKNLRLHCSKPAWQSVVTLGLCSPDYHVPLFCSVKVKFH